MHGVVHVRMQQSSVAVSASLFPCVRGEMAGKGVVLLVACAAVPQYCVRTVSFAVGCEISTFTVPKLCAAIAIIRPSWPPPSTPIIFLSMSRVSIKNKKIVASYSKLENTRKVSSTAGTQFRVLTAKSNRVTPLLYF